jgi:hypothetical protein
VAPTGVRTVSSGVYVLPGSQNVWTQAQFKITRLTGTGDDDDDDNDENGDNDDAGKGGGKKSIDIASFGLNNDSDNDDGGDRDDDDDGENTGRSIEHCTIHVTLPSSSTTLQLHNSTGQSMTVSDFKPVLSPDGQTLNVGARLNIEQNQRRGLYQGKFYVTAICE